MGFVFAALFLWLAHPNRRTMVLSLVLVLPGLWLRGYASGYVRKDTELTTTGPYAHTRNPLYLGSMLIAFGFAAAAASWVILALLALLFAAIYIPTILSEEAYLREHFAGFEGYARAVPRLLPRGAGVGRERAMEGGVSAKGGFSTELYLRHREYNSAMGAVAIYLALVLKLLFLSR
jgi:protein-S-isoprenylcysteine O-methyltransferase Ste14